MNTTTTRTNHLQKAAIYALLGRIFISELDWQSLQALKEKEIAAVFEKLQPGFQDYLDRFNSSEADAQSKLELLAADYCDLFILPKKSGLSLQASHWMSGDETDNIKQLETIIHKLNFEETQTDEFKSLPKDHLGVLLYFISSVYAAEDEKIQQLGEPITALTFQPWLIRFTEKLSAATQNPIYLASGKLLQGLLDLEK